MASSSIEKLGDIAKIEQNITNAKFKAAEVLHKVAYGEEGQPRTIRRKLRAFSGFKLEENSEEYKEIVNRISDNFEVNDLVSVSHLLNLDYDGGKNEVVDRICAFLNHLQIDDGEENDDEQEYAEEENDVDYVESEDEETDNNEPLAHVQARIHTRTSSNSFALTFKDVEDSIRPFEGKEDYPIETWIADFEDIADVTGWNPLQKLIFAKKSLGGMAKLFVQAEKGIKSWSTLKRKLLEEFQVKVSSVNIHKMLMDRKKKFTESVSEYTLVMREIGSRANLEPEIIIQYIIDGIKDETSHKVVLYGATNFSDLKQKVKLYEQIKSKETVNNSNKSDGRQTTTKWRGVSEPERTRSFSYRGDDKKYPRPEQRGSAPRNCFNCGRQGHKSATCPDKLKGLKCFKCGEFGHIATKCSAKQQEQENQRRTVHTVEVVPKNALNLTIGAVHLKALFDTGSDINAIREDVYESQLRDIPLTKEKIQIRGIGVNKVDTLGYFRREVDINDEKVVLLFHIIPRETSSYKAIVGTDLLEQLEVIIRDGNVDVYKKGKSHFLMEMRIEKENDEIDLGNIENKESRKAVKDLIKNYQPIGTKSTEIKMKIVMKDDEPVYQHPRRLSAVEKEEVEKQMSEWLADGIIRPSCSDYASPIVLVKKRDGKTRICCDYRKINKKIVKDRFPLPLIEDVLDRLQGAKYFSTIDLKNGFFHVGVDEESVKFTSFVTPSGQFEFLRCPFGLCNSPAVFQRFITHIFRDLSLANIALYYMDDIIILSSTEEEGVKNLRKVLELASSFGLEIKKEKCQFLRKRVDFLGFIIEDGKVQPSEEKSKAIKKFPEPKSIKHIQSFLGLTGYFRKFIFAYALIAKPLSDVLKREQKFVFGPEQRQSFEKLKELLTSEPVLHIYKQDAETQLHTDASKYGYGACLMQKSDDDGKFHPVYYMSRKTSPAEERYNSYELEVLAVINAVKKFRIYLLGIKFKIITDCSAFQKTMDKKDLTTRVARWALLLEEYSYEIEHRRGSRMAHVDALSRYPIVMSINDLISQEVGITKRLKIAQEHDEHIGALRKIVSNEPYQDFMMKNDILYKYNDGLELVVVPESMQTEIVKKAHDIGHFAVAKTEEIIKREFYIPKLSEKIQACIRNCVTCILGSRKEGKKEGMLHPIAKGDGPLTTYHVDHLGPLPSTNKNYQHIFAVIDDFSKFVWLYPTKSTTSKEVIDKLMVQQKTFGNPARIISDKGTAFTSHEFQEYCNEEGIERVTITTGVPRGNGQVERVNRIIIPVLTKLSIDDPNKWFKHVERAQRALNSTIQRSIDTTPFEVLLGVKMRTKEDVQIKEILEKEAIQVFNEYREELRNNSKQQILKVQEENRKHYNLRRRKPRAYKLGDLVAIKRTQFGAGLKLCKKYLGPYEISKIKFNDRYEVTKVGNVEGPRQTSTCAEFMKPWVSNNSESESDFGQDGRV